MKCNLLSTTKRKWHVKFRTLVWGQNFQFESEEFQLNTVIEWRKCEHILSSTTHINKCNKFILAGKSFMAHIKMIADFVFGSSIFAMMCNLWMSTFISISQQIQREEKKFYRDVILILCNPHGANPHKVWYDKGKVNIVEKIVHDLISSGNLFCCYWFHGKILQH